MKTLKIVGENASGAWRHTRTACRGIVMRKGLLLLSYETVTGQWMLPGGGLEDGEDEAACCAREVAEETGLVIRPAARLLEIDEYYEDWKYVSLYFAGEIVGRTAPRLTAAEQAVGMTPRWLPLPEARAIFADHARYADTDEMRRGLYLREHTALRACLDESR